MSNEEWLELFEETARAWTEETKNKSADEIDKLALKVLKKAIRHGFDINFQDGNDYTVLAFAAEYNRIRCVEYLLSLNDIDTSLYVGESDDSIEGTALHIAAFKGHLAVIKALVKQSPDEIDLEEGGGYTPLHETILNKQYPAFKLLLQLGADDEIPTVRTGTSITLGSLNAFQLIAHCASEDNSSVYSDMLEYLILHKENKGEDVVGNVPDTSDEESTSDSYDSQMEAQDEFLEDALSNISDEFVRDAMIDYYKDEGREEFFGPKIKPDYIPAQEVIQKSQHPDLKRSYDEAYLEYESFKGKKEDPVEFDSDSEEELEYENKSSSINSSFPLPAKGTQLVLSARGNHFAKNAVDQAERKRYVAQSHSNMLPSWGIYSANTHKHAKIDFSLPTQASSSRQQALQQADKKTQQCIHELAKEENVIPVLQHGNRASRALYDQRLEEMIQRYVNSYKTFQADIQLAQSKTEKNTKNDRTKKKQSCLGKIKGNPFISTSEDIGVGLEYAFAILNYDKKVTHQPNDDKMKEITLMPRYRKNGELRHPYLGVIFVTLHTQEEIQKDSVSVLDLFSRFKIDVKKTSAGSHESSGYVRALERIFFAGIDDKHICIAKVVRLPNLYHAYRPELLSKKYGLTLEQYQKFKEELRTYGTFIPSTKKMRNEQQFYRTQENIIQCVIAHEREHLIQHIQSWALAHQIQVGTINERGEFVANIDIDIAHKVQSASVHYKYNKVAAVTSTIIEGRRYNVVKMKGDGNCLFHALSHGLQGTLYAYNANQLRCLAVEQLTQFPQQYQAYVEDDQTIDQYIRTIRQNGAWAGELEIRALADRLGMRISVVNQLYNRNNITDYNENANPRIYLSYNGSDHYDSFELDNTNDVQKGPGLTCKI